MIERIAIGYARPYELAISQDGCQQVIEVVGDAAGEPPDRFHLLSLTELLFEPLPFQGSDEGHHDTLDHAIFDDREVRIFGGEGNSVAAPERATPHLASLAAQKG